MKWFSHDTRARADQKLLKARLKFGADGYYVFFMGLELQGEQDRGFTVDFSVAHDFLVEERKLKQIYTYLAEIGLIDAEQWKSGIFYAPKLVERADNYSKQKRREGKGEIPEVEKKLNEWAQLIGDVWNSTALPKVQNWSGPRKDKLKARLSNPYFKANWKKAIEKMGASDFCVGKTGKGWKASIDFFLENDNNFVKALEGKYDNNAPKKDKFLGQLGLDEEALENAHKGSEPPKGRR